MAAWDPKKGVLYHEYNKFYKERSLREVDEPNLLRNIFPYTEVPKVDFDFALIPINPARNFLITDTTFRDGQQARPPFTVDQISSLFDFLHRLSGPRGIIRQSILPLYQQGSGSGSALQGKGIPVSGHNRVDQSQKRTCRQSAPWDLMKPAFLHRYQTITSF